MNDKDYFEVSEMYEPIEYYDAHEYGETSKKEFFDVSSEVENRSSEYLNENVEMQHFDERKDTEKKKEKKQKAASDLMKRITYMTAATVTTVAISNPAIGAYLGFPTLDSETETVVVFDTEKYGDIVSGAGGVLLVCKDELYGALDYELNELLPCEYRYGSWEYPTLDGLFILGDNVTKEEYEGDKESEHYYVFNNLGQEIEDFYNADVLAVSNMFETYYYREEDGYYTGTQKDYYNGNGELIFSQKCDFDSIDNYVSRVGFKNDKTILARSLSGDFENVEYGLLDKNGQIVWKKNPNDKSLVVDSNFQDGYLTASEQDYFNGNQYLLDEDFKVQYRYNLKKLHLDGPDHFAKGIPQTDEDSCFNWLYTADGATYDNYGTKMVWYIEGRYFLVDLAKYPGMTEENMDDRIVLAVHDGIWLSEGKYWTFKDYVDDRIVYGYMDHDGNTLATYTNVTEFVNGRALVAENNTIYLIDENFHKVKTLAEHSNYVMNAGEILYYYADPNLYILKN